MSEPCLIASAWLRYVISSRLRVPCGHTRYADASATSPPTAAAITTGAPPPHPGRRGADVAVVDGDVVVAAPGRWRVLTVAPSATTLGAGTRHADAVRPHART